MSFEIQDADLWSGYEGTTDGATYHSAPAFIIRQLKPTRSAELPNYTTCYEFSVVLIMHLLHIRC